MIYIYYTILIVIFYIGGVIQAIGLLGSTHLTIIVNLFMIIVNIFYLKKLHKRNLVFGLIIIPICISSFYNKTDPFLFFLYFFIFGLTPLLSYNTIRLLYKQINLSQLINFFIILGVVQLPVLILQMIFSNQFARWTGVAPYDTGFGTFFVANDHALSFLLICLVIYLITNEEKTIYLGIHKKYFILLFCLTTLIANSRISSLLLILILVLIFLRKYPIKLMIYSFISSLVIIPILFSLGIVEKLFFKFIFIYNTLTNTNIPISKIKVYIENLSVERAHLAFYFFKSETIYLGYGPYSYFNPILGEFNKFGNYSLYLWFYYDIGLLGLISYFCFLLYFLFKKEVFLYSLLFTIYSFTANTISDLSFNFILFSFMYLTYNNKEKLM